MRPRRCQRHRRAACPGCKAEECVADRACHTAQQHGYGKARQCTSRHTAAEQSEQPGSHARPHGIRFAALEQRTTKYTASRRQKDSSSPPLPQEALEQLGHVPAVLGPAPAAGVTVGGGNGDHCTAQAQRVIECCCWEKRLDDRQGALQLRGKPLLCCCCLQLGSEAQRLWRQHSRGSTQAGPKGGPF